MFRYIKQKTNKINYLNFEKTSDFSKASNVNELLRYVKDNRKNEKCCSFCDAS